MSDPERAVLREQIRRLEAIVRIERMPLNRRAIEDIIEDLWELVNKPERITYENTHAQ